VLPDWLADHFLEESGYVSSIPQEVRRNARARIRCQAVLSIEASPPSIHRKLECEPVWIKDLSVRGICMLIHTQIWPEEKLLVEFQNRRVNATCVRCRRIANSCWEIGSEINGFQNFQDDDG
jgi:hypothetical protein